jgi:sigma-B regulation protein RsbU (phosphoserine phosphatase)
VAVVVAAFLTRRIGGRVSALRAGAQQLARGDLEARIDLGGNDKFSDLAATFNRMAGDLRGGRG